MSLLYHQPKFAYLLRQIISLWPFSHIQELDIEWVITFMFMKHLGYDSAVCNIVVYKEK